MPTSVDLSGDPPEWELRLAQLLQDLYDGGVRRVVRTPRKTVTAASALLRLPMLTLDLDDSLEGRAIRGHLSRISSKLGWLFRQKTLADVLAVPAEAGDYVQGRSRQTLRRKVRQAEKAGITWREENSAEERARLLKKLAEWERVHPLEQYRIDDPQLDYLVDFRLWLVAESRSGEPLLLAAIPVSGQWALLRYFRSIGAGDEQSLARYYMTKVLVEELSKRGVRFLIDSHTPHLVPSGLRHFQRMTGWRLARLRFAS
ncbi:hypothetical protein [Cryptosporangium phraense]|uniref:Uncharacterized protein n=1 Tax=Cryptosporangium phraense TaxID=2593070 RepID=A0A545ANX6_9ACTN|nr:hypothetical protein [Cryptosporangium phraense]TQS43042.1 hypothetical protein FL583_21660 [Cryptosporangium phraense]